MVGIRAHYVTKDTYGDQGLESSAQSELPSSGLQTVVTWGYDVRTTRANHIAAPTQLELIWCAIC
jgi:hypothetical protein